MMKSKIKIKNNKYENSLTVSTWNHQRKPDLINLKLSLTK